MLSHIPILGYVGPGALTEGLFPRQNCCASLKSLSRGLLMLRCIYGQRPSKREGAFVPAVAVRELTESSPAGQLRSADTPGHFPLGGLVGLGSNLFERKTPQTSAVADLTMEFAPYQMVKSRGSLLQLQLKNA